MQLRGLEPMLQRGRRELREFQGLAEGCWDTWEQLSSEGTVSGSLFLGIDGKTYYYMGI